MEVNGFSRTLMKGRNWNLRSYLRVPSVTGTGRTLTVTTNPILMFQYDPRLEYGQPRLQDATFKINQRNFPRVLQFFYTAEEWLGEKFKDLYLLDEKEGHLMVNMDYQGLEVLVKGSRYDAQAMLGLPIVYVEDGKEEPGLGIAINKKEYLFAMKKDDVQSILNCLENFSFQSESMLLTQLAMNPQLWEEATGMSDPRIKPSSGNTYQSVGWSDAPPKLTW